MFSFKKIQQHCKHLKKKPHTLESNLDKKKEMFQCQRKKKYIIILKDNL